VLTTIAIARNVCSRAGGALLLLSLCFSPKLEAQVRTASALSLHGSARQAAAVQRTDSAHVGYRHYADMPEANSSRAPLIGALIGSGVMTAFAVDECSRLGCMSPLSVVLAAGAGAMVGASVGWIVKRVRAPLPHGVSRGSMNQPDDQLGDHLPSRARSAAPPSEHHEASPGGPAAP
jgi:hypothetical protein